MNSDHMSVRDQAERARSCVCRLANLSRAQKDAALSAIAADLRASVERIGRANALDVQRARAAGLNLAMIDRLRMGPNVVEDTARGVEHVVTLDDPVGSCSGMVRRPNGLLVGRQRIALGVIGMVYESRPNVTVDAAALCLKAGNAALLRGGKEAAETNRELGELLRGSLAKSGLPEDAVQIIPADTRDTIGELVSLVGLVDLVIPRGGEGLIRFVTEQAKVPVIQHFKGVCHLYLDAGCDVSMATALASNGKVQRPGVCNALECLLVDAGDAERILPPVARALLAQGVELRGCPQTCQLVPEARAASDDDWGAEYLDKILAIRVVAGLDAALQHVARYGSNHTEAICTNVHAHAQRWLAEVDASCVLVNASTRFNDGGQLGLGAEIGISTTKLHAYGPMGLESSRKGKTGRVTVRPGPTRRVSKPRSSQARQTPSDESKRMALLAAEAGLDKRASAVDIVDVTDKVDYADYLVLMTGQNDRHVAAIARAVDEHLSRHGFRAASTEGLPAARWVLTDFVDVVVHVFLAESRSLYDLDGLWVDARRIPVPFPQEGSGG
jgi:glutamate-5-semialdehyde dehydrogenase